MMRQPNLPFEPKKALPSVTLINGDCLDVMPTLPEKCVQMVFADLPYAATNNTWDLAICLDRLWPEIWRLIDQRAASVFTATQPFATLLVSSQKSHFRYDLVWQKTHATGHLNANFRPLSSHEGIYVFSQSSCNAMSRIPMYYSPQMVEGGPYVRGMNKSRCGNYGIKNNPGKSNASGQRHPASILTVAKSKESAFHPTQKPVALLEWLIRTYTHEGDTVLDPVFGSGTTAIACLRTGRNFIGIEKDPEYFRIGSDRVEKEKERLLQC